MPSIVICLSFFSVVICVIAARKSSTPRAGPAMPRSHVMLEPYSVVVPQKSSVQHYMAIRDDFVTKIGSLENVGSNAKDAGGIHELEISIARGRMQRGRRRIKSRFFISRCEHISFPISRSPNSMTFAKFRCCENNLCTHCYLGLMCFA